MQFPAIASERGAEFGLAEVRLRGAKPAA